MHDTWNSLLSIGPARHHQELLTFGLLYAFTENFMLPLFHDEVGHGRVRSGKNARRPSPALATSVALCVYVDLRAKNYMFMGNQFGREREWICRGAGLSCWGSANTGYSVSG